MEEQKRITRSQKRKERISPDHVGDSKAKNRIKKVKQSSLFDYINSSDEEEYRYRTPSGSTADVNVNQLKNFFMRKSKKMSAKAVKENQSLDSQSEVSETELKCVQSGDERATSANQSGVNCQHMDMINMLEADRKQTGEDYGNLHDVQNENNTTECESDTANNEEQMDQSCFEEPKLSPNKEHLFELAKKAVANQANGIKGKMFNFAQKSGRSEEVDQINSEQTKQKKVEDMGAEISKIKATKQTSPMPESINLPMVWEMFAELKQKLDKLESDGDQRTEAIVEKHQEQVMESIVDVLEEGDLQITKVKAELAHYKHKTDVLTSICDSLHAEVCDLTQKLESIELNNAKRSISVSGLLTPTTKKEEMVPFVENFLEEAIGVQASVEDVYYLGASENKVLIVELLSVPERRAILSNKTNLKNFRQQGRKVFINEFLPVATQEKCRRERKIRNDLQNDEETKNFTTEYTRAGFTIQGTPYRKKITPPTPKEMVNLPIDELEEILKMKMFKGQDELKDGSKFSATAAKVDSFTQIRKLYMHMKLTRPDAKHIACAY